MSPKREKDPVSLVIGNEPWVMCGHIAIPVWIVERAREVTPKNVSAVAVDRIAFAIAEAREQGYCLGFFRGSEILRAGPEITPGEFVRLSADERAKWIALAPDENESCEASKSVPFKT